MNEEKLLIPVNMAVMFFRAKLEPNVMLSYIRDEFQNGKKKWNCVFIFVFIIFYIYSHFLAGNLVPDKKSPILKLVSHYARKHFEIDHLLSLH